MFNMQIMHDKKYAAVAAYTTVNPYNAICPLFFTLIGLDAD